MASWCDKLASTPAVGFRFTSAFIPSDAILSAFSPVLNAQVDGDRQTFTIETLEPFAAHINTESGFKYQIDPNALSVTYNHRIKASPASAGPPIMELISKPAPYTELLDDVIDMIHEAAALLPPVRGRLIKQVGVVSQTQVHLEDAPPGIISLFGEIGRPLGGEVQSFNVAITNVINRTDGYLDRCIHTLGLPDDEKKLINVLLDWQRVYTDPKTVSAPTLKNMLETAKSEALAYYERVAEGGLADGIDSGS